MTRTFDVTISSPTAAYTDKEPIGYPILNRKWNRADQCIFVLQPFTKTEIAIDMDPVQRGDEITLEIDGEVAFFGEVIEKKTDSSQGEQMIIITADDFLRLGSEFQISRDVYNGLSDRAEYEIDKNYLAEIVVGDTPIDTSIQRISGSVQNFEPFGSYIFANLINLASDFYRVFNDTVGVAERQIGFLFKPKGVTMTGIWIGIWDPEDQVGSGTTNTTQVDRDILVDVNTVIGTTGILIPNIQDGPATRLTFTASFSYNMDFKETWRIEATSTNNTSGTFGDLNWVLATTGGSRLDIVTGSGGGHPALGWGDNFARLNHTGGDTVSVTTTDSVAITNQSDSGWLSFQFIVSVSSDIGAGFEVYMRDDGPTDRLVASVDVTSGNMTLNFGESQTLQFVTGYSTTNAYYFHFRFNKKKHTFDMWYIEFGGLRDLNEVGWNFPILDREDWTSIPTQISQLVVSCDGAASGDLDLGFVNGNEIGSFGGGYINFARWAYLDLSDDPVFMDVDRTYAVRVSMAGTGSSHTIGTETVFMNRGLQGVGSTGAIESGIEFRRFIGPSTWENTDVFGDTPMDPLAIILGFDTSWVPSSFEFEEDTSEVIFNAGVNFSGVTNSRVLQFVTGSGDVEGAVVGPIPFNTARAVYYTNPSSNQIGITVNNITDSSHPGGSGVYTAHRMTVADVVKDVALSVPDWGDVIVDNDRNDVDDVIGSGYHDDTTNRVDSFLFHQRTAMDAMRDIADQHGAVVFISQDSSKNVTFQAIKPIGDVTDTALLNPANLPDHEYILSTNPNHDEEYLRIMTNDIGLADDKIYTDIIVKGATPDLVVHLVNWALFADLGNRHIIRKPEVFSKENSIDNLVLYAQAIADLHSVRRIEGIVKAAGYVPLFSDAIGSPPRLDINGIFRVIDENMENGTDTTGTNNVFKIAELTYNGDLDTTDIVLTNHNLNRDAQQQQINEMRDLLNGSDPSTANIDIYNYNNVDTVNLTVANAHYMGLIDANGDELTNETSPGYTRKQVVSIAAVFSGTTYYIWHAHFEAGVGTIANDQTPIETIALFTGPTGGAFVASVTGSELVITQRMYKWSDRTLTFDYHTVQP